MVSIKLIDKFHLFKYFAAQSVRSLISAESCNDSGFAIINYRMWNLIKFDRYSHDINYVQTIHIVISIGI